MNTVTIATVILIAFFAIRGFMKGFLLTAFSLASFVISIVASFVIAPALSGYLQESAFADAVNTRIERTVFAREDGDYIEQTPVQGEVQQEQNFLIESLPLPEFAKEALIDNNEIDIYNIIGATGFESYVSSYITKLVINILSFLGVFAVVKLVLVVIGHLLDLAGRLPVLGPLNKLAGLAFGAANGLLIIWVICCAATAFSGSAFGSYINNGLSASPVTSFLYNNNFVLDLMTNITSSL